MKLIVGLGNPGKEYEKTRHNSGFMAIDKLADQCNVQWHSTKMDGQYGQMLVDNEKVLLLKPQTYMNDSGKAVSQYASYYHIDPEDILVMHDDMDLPVGSVRIRQKGGSGGQKGMRSIIDALHTDQIVRIRIGVGHSSIGEHELVPDWVLSPVSKQEMPIFLEAIEDAAEAAIAWINQPIDIVMNHYNRKVKK